MYAFPEQGMKGEGEVWTQGNFSQRHQPTGVTAPVEVYDRFGNKLTQYREKHYSNPKCNANTQCSNCPEFGHWKSQCKYYEFAKPWMDRSEYRNEKKGKSEAKRGPRTPLKADAKSLEIFERIKLVEGDIDLSKKEITGLLMTYREKRYDEDCERKRQDEALGEVIS